MADRYSHKIICKGYRTLFLRSDVFYIRIDRNICLETGEIMKSITRSILAFALACTIFPAASAGAIRVNAKQDLGQYPMACSAFEVATVDDNGSFKKSGCYDDFNSAVNAMKKLGDDAVVRHSGSYSQTKIIAMNNGIAFAYPFRDGTFMEYYYGSAGLSSASGSTYTGQHYQMKYFDTVSYGKDGNGSVHININGFDGYVSLKDVDLVPVKYFERNLPVMLGGNETYYSTPEQPFVIRPLMNTYVCAQNGNYKELMFNSYIGWGEGETPSYLDKNTVLPAADWMEAGRVYYSYNGYEFYTDQAMHNYAGEYFNYYQFLPLRSRSAISAGAYDRFLSDTGVSPSSKLYGKAQAFIDGQEKYGVNALMVFAMACLESAYGTSYFAQTRNNFFGWGAIDSNPGQAASFASAESGIQTQMATNLAGYLDMNDWRFYGSMVGNKGNGFNVKYASTAYWGIDIASIAYRIDKASHNYDGGLTDMDSVSIGLLTKFKAMAKLKTNGRDVYDLTSSNGNYQAQAMVAVLGSEGDFYRTQCTNYVVNGNIWFINSSADVRDYDWNGSVGYFRKEDVRIINGPTPAAPVPEEPAEPEQPSPQPVEEPAEPEQPVEEPVPFEPEVITEPSVPEKSEQAELPGDDSSLMRGVDAIAYDEASHIITMDGAAFFMDAPAPMDGTVSHALALVNTETHEEYFLNASTNDYGKLLTGGAVDYTAVGYKTMIDLDDIPAGNWYLRMHVDNNGRSGEGAIFTTLDDTDREYVNEQGYTVRFFANSLSKYRLEISVEKQTLNLADVNKPSRMMSLFGYDMMDISEGHLLIDGYAILYNTAMNADAHPSYELIMEDEEGNTYSFETAAKESVYDFSALLNTEFDYSMASFSADADLSGLPAGTYRMYLEVTTDACHDIFELYNTMDFACASETENRTYSMRSTETRCRYLLEVQE